MRRDASRRDILAFGLICCVLPVGVFVSRVLNAVAWVRMPADHGSMGPSNMTAVGNFQRILESTGSLCAQLRCNPMTSRFWSGFLLLASV